MINAEFYSNIVNKAISDYHKKDNINSPFINIYKEESIEGLIYLKAWIDTVQWHLEDLARDPDISPEELADLKRKIDRSNQMRTDTVEKIDDSFMTYFQNYKRNKDAKMNSESPAWLLDRLTILLLKIYHMKEQCERKDADNSHLVKAKMKLALLTEQYEDLTQCFNELIEDVKNGVKYTKIYRQVKMYNDSSFNPVLSNKKS